MMTSFPPAPPSTNDQLSPIRSSRPADELELATLSWVHWFNENRLHSSIGYLTPIEKENGHYREINSQSQPALGELALH